MSAACRSSSTATASPRRSKRSEASATACARPDVSFRLRLTLFGAALVALTLLAFGWLVYELAANSQATAQDDALKQRAADTLTSIRTAPPGEFELIGTATPPLSGAEDLQHRTDPF